MTLALWLKLGVSLSKVGEVSSMIDFQYRGSVLLKKTEKKKEGTEAAATAKTKGQAAKRCSLHKVHELLSPPIVAKLEKLRKRCSGKLVVGVNRYYFYIPDLANILMDKHIFRLTLEMAGASPPCSMQD